MSIKLSVCLVTYNQKDFICQAIDSALMQVADFEYEIIIADDCSTDGTQNIIFRYANAFPHKIKLLIQEKNVGATKNFAAALSFCSGKYIALLEGDDFWTSASKLQIQANYLDANSLHSICYHSCEIVDKFGNKKGVTLPLNGQKKSTSNLKDLISNDSFMATCSVMFRSRLFTYFPDVFFILRNVCDWSLHALNAEHGDIGFIDLTMSSYRQQSSSLSWSSQPFSEVLKNAIKQSEAFNEYFAFKYNKLFKKKIAKYYYQLAIEESMNGNLKDAISAIYTSMRTDFSFALVIRGGLIYMPAYMFKGRFKKFLPGMYYKIKKIVSKN